MTVTVAAPRVHGMEPLVPMIRILVALAWMVVMAATVMVAVGRW